MNRIEKQWIAIALAAIVVISPWPILLLSFKQKTLPHILAIPIDGPSFNAPVSSMFSRSPYFLMYDLQNNKYRIETNHFKDEKHAVGLRIAHLLLREKVGTVIVQDIGPEPYKNLDARGVRIYICRAGTIADTLHQYRNHGLQRAKGPTVRIHHGIPPP